MNDVDLASRIKAVAQKSPFISFLLLIVYVIAWALIGQFIGLGLVWLLFGVDLQTIQAIINGSVSHPRLHTIMLIIQGTQHAFATIIGSLFFIRQFESQPIADLNINKVLQARPIILMVAVVITFMLFDALIIEWNRNMDLPSFMDEMEKSMQESETVREALTKKLIDFKNIYQFLAGLLAIAVIPAIGEELVFRGLIQTKFKQIFGNVHVAVWLAGFFFSFIHFQFYGFVPRMLLGVLFGYLYVWSGNLWYPIIGHFINNGFTLLMVYLYQDKTVPYNIEDTAAVPWGTSLLSFAIFAVLLYTFKNHFTNHQPFPHE